MPAYQWQSPELIGVVHVEVVCRLSEMTVVGSAGYGDGASVTEADADGHPTPPVVFR